MRRKIFHAASDENQNMTMQINFKRKNRLILVKAATLAFTILCFGVFYHPSSSQHNKVTPSIQLKHIPERFRRLGSTPQGEEDFEEEEEEIVRAGNCANVDYANQTYLNEVDEYSLPLNELLIHLDHPIFVSPPNPNGPTIVDIGLYVHNIFELDPAKNTFEMEAYLDMIWCDPHTKFESAKDGKDKHIYLERDAEKELEEIWWPAIAFVNEKGRRVTENQEVIIESDGTVEYREKFKVTLSSKFNMRRFPFDKQVLRAEIESFAWNSKYLQFHVEQDLVGFSEDFEIPEQTITHIDEHLETVKEARDRHPFSEIVTEIHVYRNPSYYITKVCLPLSLIVAISWAVFWMDPTDLADRMAISFTAVLSSVAYQFVVDDIVPRHSNNVFLGNFILFTFLMQVGIAIENICVRTLHYRGHPMMAKMVDRISRVMVPLFFVAFFNIIVLAQILRDEEVTMEGVIAISAFTPVLLVLITWLMVRRYKTRYPEIQFAAKNSQKLVEEDLSTTSQKIDSLHFEVEAGNASEDKVRADGQEPPLLNGALKSFVRPAKKSLPISVSSNFARHVIAEEWEIAK